MKFNHLCKGAVLLHIPNKKKKQDHKTDSRLFHSTTIILIAILQTPSHALARVRTQQLSNIPFPFLVDTTLMLFLDASFCCSRSICSELSSFRVGKVCITQGLEDYFFRRRWWCDWRFHCGLSWNMIWWLAPFASLNNAAIDVGRVMKATWRRRGRQCRGGLGWGRYGRSNLLR